MLIFCLDFLKYENNGLDLPEGERELIIEDSERIENNIERVITFKKLTNIASTFHESGCNSVKNSSAEMVSLNILTNFKDVLDESKTMTDAMTPAMTVIIAGIVGFVVIAIFTGMFSMYDVIAK